MKMRIEIEKRIGYSFKNKSLLQEAFTHASYLNENKGQFLDNERLEFLGDAVLSFLVTSYLFKKYPEKKEGELTSIRSKLVTTNSLAKYTEKLELISYLQVGKGTKKSPITDSIKADLFEALLGAIYIDGGVKAVEGVFFALYEDEILSMVNSPIENWKAELQHRVQVGYQMQPKYEIISEDGPDHERSFIVVVKIEQQVIGTGKGRSKKEGEQMAAKNALESGKV